VDTRRWRCQSCGKTFMEALPAVNTKREMTDRLVRWIGQQSLKQTFASIADDTCLGWHAPVHIHLERSTRNAASLLTERLRLFSQKTARRTFLFATNFAVSHQFPSP
jgi:transposase